MNLLESKQNIENVIIKTLGKGTVEFVYIEKALCEVKYTRANSFENFNIHMELFIHDNVLKTIVWNIQDKDKYNTFKNRRIGQVMNIENKLDRGFKNELSNIQ